MYGAILNPGCRFFDKRIGQSTTLSGRAITRHMSEEINEILAGDRDHRGKTIIYNDTDSVAADSKIRTSIGETTIESLFLKGNVFWAEGDKEYSRDDAIAIAHYNSNGELDYVNYNYVYRHKVSKKRFKITTANGKEVVVTEDHSIMVMNQENKLIEKKPTELSIGDKVITIENKIKISTIASIEEMTPFEDEYVYDIGVASNDPYFFGNDVLVHNSCYFSAWPVMQESVANGAVDWSPELCVQLYDTIAEQVNQSFPTFMERAFHTSHSNGSIIRGGRESVSRRGLFIKKKRYGILIYDLEGKRLDVDGRAGKVKATGLDLKRSDTPKAVQVFLSKLLQTVLEGALESQAQEMINNFRDEFKKSPAWEKGTPKRVNNLTKFTQQVERGGKASVPGHVRASINWNTLRRMHNDNYSMAITEGQKVVVCKLRSNPMNFTSIAYPVDEAHLPTWFLELPFDHSVMETTIVDQKVGNLLGVLDWDLNNVTRTANSFNALFG